MGKGIVISLIGVTILAIVVALALRTDYGVGVDSVRWLPAEARDISYLRYPYLNTWAEFEIEQEAFEDWCRSEGKTLRRVGPNERKGVRRCWRPLEREGFVPVVPEPNKSSEQWTAWYDQRMQKHLGEGDLYYEDIWRNGGGYWIGYDVDEGKGYYAYAHH